jgi:hypothetical protein
MNRLTHHLKTSVSLSLVAISLTLVTHTATASYEPDNTPENVQKKAVIIKHDAQLYKSSNGGRGEDAPFMEIYFMMTEKRNRYRFNRRSFSGSRVPVSKQPYKSGYPEGWLDKDSFVEWNTLQMIKLEPQSGRELASIFTNRHCADLFGKYGRVYSGCQVLGEEPNRFLSGNQLQLLIPVFQKVRNSYQGGFIRVYQKDNTVTATPDDNTSSTQERSRIGYDIVFVVDSTSSMGQYFVQTTEALQDFIKQIQKSVNDPIQKTPLRIGVLFYRGREDRISLCSLEYLTKWGQHLTANIDEVINALAAEKEANCSLSDDQHAAVLDGLHRVLYETQWENNHFKSIILVGNTPPYPVYARKNPMRLSVYLTNKIARQKNIRILTFKLGQDDKGFKRLALDTVAANQGRYYNISVDSKQNHSVTFKDKLLNAMSEEWQLLTIAQNMVDFQTDKSSNRQQSLDPLSDQTFRQKYNISQYEALIIRARLPKTTGNMAEPPEFIKGWIPEEIKNQLVVGEFIFMDKFSLTKLTNTLGNLAQATLIGQQEGGMAFIRTVRNVLAAQTRVPAYRLFRSGESLAGSLQKANILPFRTDILTFTAQEVNTWKPQDYIRINTILKEKVKVLGEFMANPRNIHYFGKTPHLYVPRAFFP